MSKLDLNDIDGKFIEKHENIFKNLKWYNQNMFCILSGKESFTTTSASDQALFSPVPIQILISITFQLVVVWNKKDLKFCLFNSNITCMFMLEVQNIYIKVL